MFMSDQFNQEILDELRKQTKLWKNTTIITPVIIFIIIGLIFVSGRYFLKKDQPAMPQAKPSWTQARDAFDNCNYEDALHVAKILTEKSPKWVLWGRCYLHCKIQNQRNPGTTHNSGQHNCFSGTWRTVLCVMRTAPGSLVPPSS
jgi:hypothetical protein